MSDNPRRTRQESTSGEWWVRCDAGHEHYGEHGAAGLLVFCQGWYLVQERPPWADHGGTWGIPGGALREGEPALEGALREAYEEGMDAYGISLAKSPPPVEVVVDHGGWAYTTVVAVATGRPRTRRTREAYDWAWVRGADIYLGRGHRRFHPAVVDFFTDYRRELPG